MTNDDNGSNGAKQSQPTQLPAWVAEARGVVNEKEPEVVGEWPHFREMAHAGKLALPGLLTYGGYYKRKLIDMFKGAGAGGEIAPGLPGGDKPPASMPGGPEAVAKPPVVEPEIEWEYGYWRPKGGDIWQPGSSYQPSAPPGGAKPPASVPGGPEAAAKAPAAAPEFEIENGYWRTTGSKLWQSLRELKPGELPGGVAPAAAPAESASWLARSVDAVKAVPGRAFSAAERIRCLGKAMSLATKPIPCLKTAAKWGSRAAPWVQLGLTAWDAGKGIYDASAGAKEAYNQRDRINAGLSNDNPALRFEDVLKQRAVDGQWSPDVMKHLRHFSNSTGDSSDIPTGGMDLGVWNPMAAPRYWVDWARSKDPNKIPSGMFGFLDPDAALRIGGDYLYDKFCRPKLGPLPPPRKPPVMSAVEGPMGPPLPPPGWARPPREDPYANWNLNVGNAEQLGYPPTASLSRRERYRNVMAEAANEGFSDTAAGPPFIVPPAYPAPSPEQFRAAPAVSAPAAPAASRPSSFVPIGASFAAPSSTDAAIAELRELMRSEFAKLNGTLRIYFNCFPPSSVNTRGNYEMDQRR